MYAILFHTFKIFSIFQTPQHNIFIFTQSMLFENPQFTFFIAFFTLNTFLIKNYIQDQCIVTGNGFTSCVKQLKMGKMHKRLVFKIGHNAMKDPAH